MMTAIESDGATPGATAAVQSPLGGAPPILPPQRPKRRNNIETQNRPLYLLIPGGLLLTVVVVIPLGVGIFISLLNLDLYTLRDWLSAPFIGFGNYVEALTASPLMRSIGISIAYSLIGIALCLPLGIAAALATQNAFRGRGLVRSLFLVPYILPQFVVATVWRAMLQPDGIINNTLAGVGIDGGLWLNGPQSFWALVLVQTWAQWPFIYLLVLSGLQSVDHEVHEAAAIDGALWWTKLWYVIFPYLRGPIALAALIGTLHLINNFTMAFILFGIPTPVDIQVLPLLTYATSFQNFRFGLGAAMAMISLAIIMVPLFIYLRTAKLDTGDTEVRR